MGTDKASIHALCLDCAQHIYHSRPPERAYIDTVARLLLGTACVESNLNHRRQIGFPWHGVRGGWSLWQLEYISVETSMQYLDTHPEVAVRCANWLYGRDDAPMSWYRDYEHGTILRTIAVCDKMACLFARLHYQRFPEMIPPEPERQAVYWKRYYNTEAGAGTVERYLDVTAAWGVYG